MSLSQSCHPAPLPCRTRDRLSDTLPFPADLCFARRMIVTRLIALAAIALPATVHAQAVAPPASTYARAIAAGYKALFLCEGLFNSGRTRAQIEAVELRGIYPEYAPLLAGLPATTVSGQRSVTVRFSDRMPPMRADWFPRTGCTVQPIGAGRTRPPTLHPNAAIPVPADPRPWPMGDGGPPVRTATRLVAPVDRAFSGGYGTGVTTGVVIVRDGRIVAERYAEGFGPLVPNRTWSVAKSIAGTLVGVAVHRGKIDVNRPAALPEWSTPGDPRAGITIDQLLRMASGLHSDTAGNRTDAIYFGGTSVTEQAPSWPLEARPGTRFRYANNDILLAIRALRDRLASDDAYWNLPGDALFTPLGMQHTTPGIDWQGNFVLSSQVWSTARDLARLGELWRNDGVWQGRRILPAGWMRYMTTPSGPQPARGAGYGATLWLFGPDQGLPAGTYAAQGNRGQYVFVVPSQKLVIVRRGEDPGGGGFDAPKFVAEVIAALPARP